ncbi:MAG: pilus assembly protein [Rhizobiales bacterium]|nr:pilus assembly protein [Hyphomicrobiales bacterium]
MTIFKRHIKNIVKRLNTFQKNSEGTAAIEFAFIAPLMLAAYFGTLEVSRLYIAKNKVETVTETISDLVAQGKTTTKQELADIFSIGSKALSFKEDLEYNVVVTAIETQPDNSGTPVSRVIWSESKKGTNKHAVNSIVNDLPPGLARNFETIIMTELYYEHTALFEYFIKGPKSFDRRFYSKPRYTASIPCNDC